MREEGMIVSSSLILFFGFPLCLGVKPYFRTRKWPNHTSRISLASVQSQPRCLLYARDSQPEARGSQHGFKNRLRIRRTDRGISAIIPSVLNAGMLSLTCCFHLSSALAIVTVAITAIDDEASPTAVHSRHGHRSWLWLSYQIQAPLKFIHTPFEVHYRLLKLKQGSVPRLIEAWA